MRLAIYTSGKLLILLTSPYASSQVLNKSMLHAVEMFAAHEDQINTNL